jgi:hypothetical protein
MYDKDGAICKGRVEKPNSWYICYTITTMNEIQCQSRQHINNKCAYQLNGIGNLLDGLRIRPDPKHCWQNSYRGSTTMQKPGTLGKQDFEKIVV